MRRRQALALGAGLAAPLALPRVARAAAAGPRVLRYAFPVAESGFDPAQISDTYSRTVTAHIFEALYGYDHLARPARIVPLTADGLPEVSDDFRRWIFKVQPGIFFADDPAFQGRPRELTAADFVFAIKRYADPAVKSPLWASVEDWRMPGLAALRRQSLEHKTPFDYDAPVEGLRVLDRYRFELRFELPRPRFIDSMAVSDLFGGVAREVVQAYGDKIAEHPVGTGPFRLAQWRRSSLIVLERNPAYRERSWDCSPTADDAEGQGLTGPHQHFPEFHICSEFPQYVFYKIIVADGYAARRNDDIGMESFKHAAAQGFLRVAGYAQHDRHAARIFNQGGQRVGVAADNFPGPQILINVSKLVAR